jgi:hypothetical protein
MKGFQYRYYVRMREIEYTSYLINRVVLDGLYGKNEISAPRIDMTWGFTGYLVGKDRKPLKQNGPGEDKSKDARPWWRRMLRLGPDPCHDQPHREPEDPDYRASEPWRREPWEIYCALRHRFWWANVMLSHVVAVVLGLLLFIISVALNAAGVDHLRL